MRLERVLSVLVENKPGTLFRVVHIVRLMRLNIEGLALGVTKGGQECRLTITVSGDEAAVEHVARQLMKVIDVLEAHTFGPDEIDARELALVKVNTDSVPLAEIQRKHSTRIVDSSPHSAVVEIVGSSQQIDDFVNGLGQTNVLDIARTGIAALPKEAQA